MKETKRHQKYSLVSLDDMRSPHFQVLGDRSAAELNGGATASSLIWPHEKLSVSSTDFVRLSS